MTTLGHSATDRRQQELADEFGAAMRAFKRVFEVRLPQDLRDDLGGITPHQVEGVLCAMQAEAGITMNDLARGQGVGLSSATALADRLVKQGLADRVSDPSDRRIVRIVPTQRGREVGRSFQNARRRVLLEMLGSLSDEEATLLVTLLGRMSAAAIQGAAQ
jgi:DNA-binding MarR family transcriptional regulator